MVVEAIALICALHPGHEGDYNAFTPGLFVSVQPERQFFTPYVTAGAYRDSFDKLATQISVGCDAGKRFGIGLALAHVTGSHMEQYPVVPIPSLFYHFEHHEEHGLRIICAPNGSAFALAYTYSFR